MGQLSGELGASSVDLGLPWLPFNHSMQDHFYSFLEKDQRTIPWFATCGNICSNFVASQR